MSFGTLTSKQELLQYCFVGAVETTAHPGGVRGRCVKARKLYAPKGQHHIAQGSALGIIVYIMNNAPCKGNTLIIRLLHLQGVGLVWRIFTQGAALPFIHIFCSLKSLEFCIFVR